MKSNVNINNVKTNNIKANNTEYGDVTLSMDRRRRVTLCNHNFSHEGILHPDRVMDEYDLLFFIVKCLGPSTMKMMICAERQEFW